jgi:hypothetical protein
MFFLKKKRLKLRRKKIQSIYLGWIISTEPEKKKKKKKSQIKSECLEYSSHVQELIIIISL